jgi:TolB-like protein
VAAVAILTVIFGGGIWSWQQQADTGPPVQSESVPKLPDKPSIAVLPFINLSDDETQKYFADGMAEDIITDLSKISGLFVIARNSSFHYRGAELDLRVVGKKLGVRYILEGSVRRVGQRVRINAQLIDTTTQGHLWAERYDGSMEDVFALQDRVRAKIVSALAIRLNQQEAKALARRETNSPEAYDRFLQGWERYRKRTPQATVEALAFFVKASELDPNYGRAHAALASVYWESWERGWHEKLGLTRRGARKKAMQYLKQALERPTALAHQVASEIYRQNQRYDKAIAAAEASIALDPNNADGYVTLAGALIMVGRAGEAADLTRKAMRLDPRFPAFYPYVLGVASYGEERYDAAAKHLARAARDNPENPAFLIPLAAAYGQLGRETEAADTITRYVRLRERSAPPTLAEIIGGWPFQSDRDRKRLADGLHKAGLRGG